jgi:hypothetical protein
LAKTFLDAGAAAAHGRAKWVVVLLFLLPPILYFGMRSLTDAGLLGVQFDNEVVADARKDMMWGVAGVGFLGIVLACGLWMAHRNRRIMRVVTDDDGLLYHSMFREVSAGWAEVVRLERVPRGRREPLLRVSTRRGDFAVPPTMVEASEPLPRVRTGAGGLVLRHADGREEPATVEENALLREIRAHLAREGEADAPPAHPNGEENN